MSLSPARFGQLINKYHGDERTMLREAPSLDALYAFSGQRRGIIECFDIKAGSRVLQIGADSGACTGVCLERGCDVTVYETDEKELQKLLMRYPQVKTVGDAEQADADIPASGRYDVILSIGAAPENEMPIKHLYGLLSQGGRLFYAADNTYGIRYLTGDVPSECVKSRQEIQRELDETADGKACAQWYYPVPDYRLAATIWSDDYLPGAGDLSGVISAYNSGEIRTAGLGELYDRICRDGLFTEYAPSFLLVLTRPYGAADSDEADEAKQTNAGEAQTNAGEAQTNADEAQMNAGEALTGAGSRDLRMPIFVKYNRLRQEEYAVATMIYAGRRLVAKRALYPAGRAHIEGLAASIDILNAEGRDIDYLRPEISDDGMQAVYEYVEGETLSELTAAGIEGGESVYTALDRALGMIIGSAPVHNIDSILDNYIAVSEGGQPIRLKGIDCEWISPDEQDGMYVTWRALYAFYESYARLCPDEDEYYAHWGISQELRAKYRAMEDAWQRSITGDIQAIYLDNYRVEAMDAAQLRREHMQFRLLQERADGLRAQINDRDAQIRKMTEVKRLTDNHVTNLEVMIADLRREIDNMAATMDYLNRHVSLPWKVRRRLGDAFNRRYPRGSSQRKNIEYRLMALTHPLRYHRLTSTEEGRNLIEGDYRIGDVYRERGRLRLESCADPLVSIIIPVYNQVEYTYKCVASIIDHTEGIPYEVILADDVSSDATAQIDRFIDGLVIARNETNQGFLRNCNQAAKRARGRYIFFLNNDTQVRENWLSSLLTLMEADPGIGMAGSKLIYPDGRLQEAGGIIWSDGSGWNYGRGDDPGKCEYNYVRDVDYISGAAIMIRRSLWEEIGGFDERYAPAYCEDSDLAFEVREHGYRVVYQPLSVVVHYEGISNGTDVNGTGLKKYQKDNAVKLRQKWSHRLSEQYENTGNPDPFRARERSRGRKIVLVVDHYVPTWDRDAGSRTTYQYIRMLLDRGYEVKFLGDNFLHEEPYSTALEQMGVEILYGADMQTGIWDWIRDHESDLHFVYLNRPHIASKYIDFIKEHTKLKVIYYGHDLHYLRQMRQYMITGDAKDKQASDYWRSVELGILYKADQSYYPSQVEVDAVHEIDPDIRVKAITAYVYESFCDGGERDYAKRRDILFVGGFAHPPNKDAVLWFAGEIWPKVHERTGAGFIVVGSHADDEIMALSDEKAGIDVKGFVTDEELSRLYGTCRLAAVPLRYGAGVKGKVIEALYYGLPVVTTSVGAEGIADASAVMRTADTADELAEAIIGLYENTKELERMSSAALDYVKRHHSIDAVWAVVSTDME